VTPEALVREILAAAAEAQRLDDPGTSMVGLSWEIAELGAHDLALEILARVEREQTERKEPSWYAYVARGYAAIDRREDVARLAGLAAGAPPSDHNTHQSLAAAWGRLDDDAAADAQVAMLDSGRRADAASFVALIAARRGRLDRAAAVGLTLGKGPVVLAVPVALELARGFAKSGDLARSNEWLDRAIARGGKVAKGAPYSSLPVARAAAELGRPDQARTIADAVDRATRDKKYPYSDPESPELGEVYALLGDRAKVAAILDGFTQFHATSSASGFASTARAHARLDDVEGARLLLAEAETRLVHREQASGTPDDIGRASITGAQLALGDIADALRTCAGIGDPAQRSLSLLAIAREARRPGTTDTDAVKAALAAVKAASA
jgi:hypothetical protein